jgi:hypothetical protein
LPASARPLTRPAGTPDVESRRAGTGCAGRIGTFSPDGIGIFDLFPAGRRRRPVPAPSGEAGAARSRHGANGSAGNAASRDVRYSVSDRNGIKRSNKSFCTKRLRQNCQAELVDYIYNNINVSREFPAACPRKQGLLACDKRGILFSALGIGLGAAWALNRRKPLPYIPLHAFA